MILSSYQTLPALTTARWVWSSTKTNEGFFSGWVWAARRLGALPTHQRRVLGSNSPYPCQDPVGDSTLMRLNALPGTMHTEFVTL